MKVIILGSGSAYGAPMIFNSWRKLNPNHPKNIRNRASIYMEIEGKKFVVDCGPEFRLQINENNISDILQHYILGIISSITVAIKDIIEKNNHILSRQEQIFYSFIQKVQGNYNKEREVVFYAKELCISPKYLSKIVFESSGKYAKDWIKEYVILAAKALLKSNDYTVQQISYMLNFPNNSFFGKYFKSAVGCSPKKYQETGNSEKNIK